MLTYPKSTKRVRRMPMHLSSGPKFLVLYVIGHYHFRTGRTMVTKNSLISKRWTKTIFMQKSIFKNFRNFITFVVNLV